MKPEEFKSFEDETPQPHKHLIVTNNLNAKDAHGEMSHVWMVTFWIRSSDRNKGIVSFDDGEREILDLTHWKYA